MQLVPPSLDRLPSYVAALKRGWSPDNIKGAAASIEELAQIEKDPRSFVESLTDREGKGPADRAAGRYDRSTPPGI